AELPAHLETRHGSGTRRKRRWRPLIQRRPSLNSRLDARADRRIGGRRCQRERDACARPALQTTAGAIGETARKDSDRGAEDGSRNRAVLERVAALLYPAHVRELEGALLAVQEQRDRLLIQPYQLALRLDAAIVLDEH